MKCLTTVFLILLIAQGVAGEINESPQKRRELQTNELIRILPIEPGKGLDVAKMEAMIGPPDKVEPSPQWRNSRLKTYFLSNGRRLEVTEAKIGTAYLAVIVDRKGNTLVFK